jgi:lipopolysaccharide biosynthesis glycosyltransferase
MNLNYFRENNVAQRILIRVNDNKDNPLTFYQADQGALNAILYNKRLVLPLKYNALDRVFIGPRNRLFSQKERSEARKNPVIIHYACAKPRKKRCFHPQRTKYHEYRKLAGLPPIVFQKSFELKLLIKNLINAFGSFCLNAIPRKLYVQLIKPKYLLS